MSDPGMRTGSMYSSGSHYRAAAFRAWVAFHLLRCNDNDDPNHDGSGIVLNTDDFVDTPWGHASSLRFLVSPVAISG